MIRTKLSVISNIIFNAEQNIMCAIKNLLRSIYTKIKNNAMSILARKHDMLNRVLQLVPLGKLKETSADKLMLRLRQEAEALRREKKRNTPSGIHKSVPTLLSPSRQSAVCATQMSGTYDTLLARSQYISLELF